MPIGEHTPPDVGGGLVQGRSSLLTLAFSGNLDAIDPLNGKTSFVGPTGLHDCSMPDSLPDPKCANVIGQLGATLYATDFAQNLYTVDPVIGGATLIGSTGIPQLTFVPLSNACPNCVYNESLFSFGGKLYANYATATRTSTGHVIGTVPQLWEINTTTGAATPGPLLVNANGNPAIGLTSIVNVDGIIYAFNAAIGQVVTINYDWPDYACNCSPFECGAHWRSDARSIQSPAPVSANGRVIRPTSGAGMEPKPIIHLVPLT
jgi:hypothetical protein